MILRSVASACVCVVVLLCVGRVSGESAAGYMASGQRLRGLGQLNEALDAFDRALAIDGGSYLTHFYKAAVQLQLGRTAQARVALGKVVELRPELAMAWLERARVHMAEGSLDLAIKDAVEAQRLATSSTTTTTTTSTTLSDTNALVETLTAVSETNLQADAAVKRADWDAAVTHLSALLAVGPHCLTWRLQRATAYESKGDLEMAIADLTRAVRLDASRLDDFPRMAALHLRLGEPESAFAQVKECRRGDPDHKECRRLYLDLRKIEKTLAALKDEFEANKYAAVVAVLVGKESKDGFIFEIEARKYGPKLLKRLYDMACVSFGALKKWPQTTTYCSKTLDIEPANLEALMNRAESYIHAEEYDLALLDFKKAHDLDNQNQRAIEGYNKAQRLVRQASRRDYYKILGVPRDASTREIKRSFRKLAQEWHPDKYRGPLPKEKVQAKMAEINQAYEVLNNDELRERFDNGDDPHDPASGQNGGGGFGGGGFNNFFQQGGFPFGGGAGGGGNNFNFKARYG